MTDAATAPKLTQVEQIIYDRLRASGELSIAVLYCAAFGVAFRDLPPKNQTRQQHLGSRIASLNKKILPTGERVVPGEARQSYRLSRV